MEETQTNKDFKPIVIKELFMDKNPRMARMIPGFVYGFLRRTLDLDYTNEILQKYGHTQGVKFSDAGIISIICLT